MRPNAATLGWGVALLLIVLAAAARSGGAPTGTDAAVKAKAARLREELARRPREGAAPSEPEAAAGAVPGPAPKEIVVRPERRSPADRGFVFKSFGSLVLREDKLALLRKALEGSSDAASKSRALSLLSGVGGSEATGLAVSVLESDGPSWLRLQAAGVLAALGDAAALGPLLEASRTPDLHLRVGVGVALDRLGMPGPLQELIGTLSEMLDHPDGGRREDAVDLLSTIRMSAACVVLAKALGDRTNRRIREAAADALGQTGSPDAIPWLEGALLDDEPGVRQAAQAALVLLRTAKP